jgi:peptidoglycan hydrolase-like protein with peptidoglycan-binding domain
MKTHRGFWPEADPVASDQTYQLQLGIRRERRIALALFALALAIVAGIAWVGTSERGVAAPASYKQTGPSLAAPSQAPSHVASEIWLQRGSSGGHVEEVQSTLSGYGYTVTVDGDYGPQTERAVTSWQRSNGLWIDGVVGSQTWGSLSPDPSSPSPDATSPSVAKSAQESPSGHTWDGPIPEYDNRGRCTQAKADSITGDFAAAGASRSTQEWSLLIASRESGCDHTKHNLNARTRDDSYSIAMINAQSGIFTTKLKGWDRHRALSDWDYAVDMYVELWTHCGRGPWDKAGGYWCRKPTS